MPFGDKATEDFVLGQRSGFGKDMDKEYKNSSVKKRQRDLVRFLTAQGEEQNKNNKIMDDRFEKSINSPAYASAQNLNNFAGSGREVKYNLAGRGRVMADPNPNNPFRDIYEFARANPQAFETMLQGTLAQSPTKILGYGAEKLTGDSTTGNRISEGVLDELTQQQSGKSGGRFGFRPEMTDEEKRVAGNAFYAQQLKDNEGRDIAKSILQEGGFTTDATYGDALDTASLLIPGPGMAVKGLGVGVKASRLALAAAKASGRGVKGAAGRTSADALSAASGGLLRGSPVRAAREAAGGQSYKGFAIVKPDAALDELAKNEWTTGSTMDITSTGELLDSINYGGYGRRTDPKLTSAGDTNNINIDQLTPDEINNMSPETLDLLQNQPVLQQLGKEGTVALRGINEPVRARVQKYPTQAEFNKRLSGERLSGADAKLKQELYDEAIALIEESGGYWRVTNVETGKNIGGMDIAHRQHYVEGGKAVDTSGRKNVEVQERANNRLQGAEGVGGAEGFSKWWKANKNTASNRAILEALLYEIY